MPPINRTITIEDLVFRYPGSVAFLLQRGLPCIVCGEPLWGTLEEMARSRGRSEGEIDQLITSMNMTLAREDVP